jgi:L-threonylcarbamoyladenylate synthase
MKAEIEKALEVLRSGGVILYPTDTIWGIGCDATNSEAVDKIFRLKLLDTPNKLESYVSEVPSIAYDLIEYAEKPLTIIYSGAKNLAANVIHEDGSVGIRIVKHQFCEQLISRFRRPIVSTSANISGNPSPGSFSDISSEVINNVDYVVNLQQNELSASPPSTIMKLAPDGQFTFIRR